MKQALILGLIFCFCQYSLFSQGKFENIAICNTEQKKLNTCTEGNYVLQFEKKALLSFTTKDSSILYDVEKKILSLLRSDKSIITLSLKNEGILNIHDSKNDSSFERSTMRNDNNCGSQSVFIDQLFSNGVGIYLTYQYCRLVNIGIGDEHFGEVNLFVFQQPGKNFFSWDITIYQAPNSYKSSLRTIKILSERKYGKPDLVVFCDRIKEEHYKQCEGIEIVSERKKSNQFYKIRKVISNSNPNLFSYEDLIVYDKKGKLKSSKITFGNCDNK